MYLNLELRVKSTVHVNCFKFSSFELSTVVREFLGKIHLTFIPKAISEEIFSMGQSVVLKLEMIVAGQFLVAAKLIICCVSISGLQEWQARTNRI